MTLCNDFYTALSVRNYTKYLHRYTVFSQNTEERYHVDTDNLLNPIHSSFLSTFASQFLQTRRPKNSTTGNTTGTL